MERRRSARKPVAVNVYVSLPSTEKLRCTARNLSAKGVFLETDNLLPIEKPLQMFFALKKQSATVIQLHCLTARVVRFEVNGVALVFCRRALNPGRHAQKGGPQPEDNNQIKMD